METEGEMSGVAQDSDWKAGKRGQVTQRCNWKAGQMNGVALEDDQETGKTRRDAREGNQKTGQVAGVILEGDQTGRATLEAGDVGRTAPEAM